MKTMQVLQLIVSVPCLAASVVRAWVWNHTLPAAWLVNR